MLKGKGFYIWKIRFCEGGDPASIAQAAVDAGLTHVGIKVADGRYLYNIYNNVDLVPPVVDALRKAGVEVFGWQYVYGDDPAGEAGVAIRRIKQLSLSHFVVNAEVEYKRAGKAEAAKGYMRILRAGVQDCQLGLSTFRFPTIHPQFPFDAFAAYMDYMMPQVYWMQAHNPRTQLIRSLNEYRQFNLPVIPTGASFLEHGWQPTAGEVSEFLVACKELGVDATNFWEWGNCKKYVPGGWAVIKAFDWGQPAPGPLPTPEGERYVALSSGLRIRKGPGLGYPILGSLTAGEQITAVEDKTVERWIRHGRGWSATNYQGQQLLRKA